MFDQKTFFIIAYILYDKNMHARINIMLFVKIKFFSSRIVVNFKGKLCVVLATSFMVVCCAYADLA